MQLTHPNKERACFRNLESERKRQTADTIPPPPTNNPLDARGDRIQTMQVCNLRVGRQQESTHPLIDSAVSQARKR